MHNTHLMLKIRQWCCLVSETNHDRDVNAAINIKRFALQNQDLGVVQFAYGMWGKARRLMNNG